MFQMPSSSDANAAPKSAGFIVDAASGGLTAERVITDNGVVAWDVATAGQVAVLLSFDGTPNTDHSSNGPTTNTFNAGETVTVMDLVYMHSDGEWHLTDADAAATAQGMLAISLESKTDGQAMKVALPNSFVRDDTWNWTVGATLYVGLTAGQITATAPSATDDVVRIVGWAVTADVIWFGPSSDYATVV